MTNSFITKEKKMPRIGIIGRADLGGLGIETKYFYKWMKPTKVMLVQIGVFKHFPENFPGATVVVNRPNDAELREFCKDIDVLFCFETPYNWNAFRIAKEMGVKTGMFIDYEWTPIDFIAPDVIINPSDYHMKDLPERAVHITFPVDREVHPFKLRKTAKTFLHIVGHGGSLGRNGTAEFLKAIPLVKSNVKFIIHSQIPVEKIDDPRIEWRVGNYINEGDMYKDADVLVSPRKFAALSLPLNEAMSHGLAIIMTDMHPQNKFLPKDLLIPTCDTTSIMITREIEMGFMTPEAIAEKIDQIANKDITKYSNYSNEWAESISWTNLRQRILDLLV